MKSAFVSRATQQPLHYDTVIWDADWYNNQGWTVMIHTFLLAKPNGTAVVFQKKAEVPGFHPSYWELYKTFPNRIQVVVLNDDVTRSDLHSTRGQEQHDWIAKQREKGTLTVPDDTMRWLNVALVQRIWRSQNQLQIPVIAMNGGAITTAMAALETSWDSPIAHTPIQWTVYEAWTAKGLEYPKALIHYASTYKEECEKREKEYGTKEEKNLTLFLDENSMLNTPTNA